MTKRSGNPVAPPQLLTLLAHDLRSPLAAIMTNLGFIETGVSESDPETRDAITDSRVSCSMLEHLIGNLEILASSGGVQHRERVSAWELVRLAAGRYASLRDALEVALEIVPGDASPTMLVAPGLIGRAIDNLLTNAVQYSRPRDKIRVQVEQRGERGVIVIRDRGPIVPSEMRHFVLSAEGQALAKQRAECRYSRGMGLYCAAQAAAAAGAEVSVGEIDGTSAFLLSAPLASYG